VGDYIQKGKQAKAMAGSAADSLLQNYNDLNTRAAQEQASASDAVRRIQRQVQAAQGQTVTMSGAAGVTGQSVSAALNTLVADGASQIDEVNTNLGTTLDQITRQKEGSKAAANNRANQVAAPSALATGLQIGGSALELSDRLKRRSTMKSNGSASLPIDPVFKLP
jgi:hypothetical protein